MKTPPHRGKLHRLQGGDLQWSFAGASMRVAIEQLRAFEGHGAFMTPVIEW
jgi:hypothetical protein